MEKFGLTAERVVAAVWQALGRSLE